MNFSIKLFNLITDLIRNVVYIFEDIFIFKFKSYFSIRNLSLNSINGFPNRRNIIFKIIEFLSSSRFIFSILSLTESIDFERSFILFCICNSNSTLVLEIVRSILDDASSTNFIFLDVFSNSLSIFSTALLILLSISSRTALIFSLTILFFKLISDIFLSRSIAVFSIRDIFSSS